jgi:hypothetical protein
VPVELPPQLGAQWQQWHLPALPGASAPLLLAASPDLPLPLLLLLLLLLLQAR